MIKILLLTANPFTEIKFDFANQVKGIVEAIEKAPYSEQLMFEYERDGTFAKLKKLFATYLPDIVHLAMPGHFEQGLFFADSFPKGSRPGRHEFEQGWQARPWHELIDLLQSYHIQCLVLLIPIPPEIAQRISSNVSALVTVDNSINLNQTAAFSAGFYEGLGSGKGISYAFRQGNYKRIKADNFDDNTYVGKPIILWSPEVEPETATILTLPKPGEVEPSSFQQMKRKMLEDRHASLLAEYQAIYKQIDNALSEVERIRIKRQAEILEKEITQVEQDIASQP